MLIAKYILLKLLYKGSKYTTFVSDFTKEIFDIMKGKEFHRKLQQLGKKSKRGWYWTGEAEGSHYIYEDNEGTRYPVPYHGAKEFPEGLRKRILKDMGLN